MTKMKLIFYVSGHRNLTKGDFEKHYIPEINIAISKDAKIIVGDIQGCDTMTQHYLNTQKYNNVEVYHLFDKEKLNVGKFGIKGGFIDDEDKTEQMLLDSNRDITWIHPKAKNKKSRTECLSKKRKELELNNDVNLYNILRFLRNNNLVVDKDSYKYYTSTGNQLLNESDITNNVHLKSCDKYIENVIYSIVSDDLYCFNKKDMFINIFPARKTGDIKNNIGYVVKHMLPFKYPKISKFLKFKDKYNLKCKRKVDDYNKVINTLKGLNYTIITDSLGRLFNRISEIKGDTLQIDYNMTVETTEYLIQVNEIFFTITKKQYNYLIRFFLNRNKIAKKELIINAINSNFLQ